MKFSVEFIDVLKKFSLINKDMYFVPGKVQTTMIGTKGTNSTLFFARAFTNTEIDQAFGIGDLSRFLAALKNFKEPEINVIEDKYLEIIEGQLKMQYTLTNPTYLMYKQEPEKIKPLSAGMAFQITKKDIDIIKNMYGVFGSPHIYFQNSEDGFYVGVNNFENPTSDIGSVKLGEPEVKGNFKAVISAPMFKIDSADYKLHISLKGLVYFGNEKMEFFIPTEKKWSEL